MSSRPVEVGMREGDERLGKFTVVIGRQ